MWPFSRTKKIQLPLQRVIEEAENKIAERWTVFSQLPFKDDVGLRVKVEAFIPPAMEGVIRPSPALVGLPTEIVMLIFANGILKAGTHSALEIQDALGIPRS